MCGSWGGCGGAEGPAGEVGRGTEIEFLGSALRQRHSMFPQRLCVCTWPCHSGPVPAVSLMRSLKTGLGQQAPRGDLCWGVAGVAQAPAAAWSGAWVTDQTCDCFSQHTVTRSEMFSSEHKDRSQLFNLALVILHCLHSSHLIRSLSKPSAVLYSSQNTDLQGVFY